MFDPLSILALFAPVAVEGVKALINKFTDEYKPKSVDEWVSMRKSEIDLFVALNSAGGTGPTYPWVDAAVKLMRPAVGVIVLGTWAYMHISGAPDTASIDNFASAVGFYLFGDRTLFYAKRAKEVIGR